MRKSGFAFVAAAASLVACTAITVEQQEFVQEGLVTQDVWPETLVFSLEEDQQDSKTSYEWDNQALKTSWCVGDTVAVTLAFRQAYSSKYVATGAGSVSTFERVIAGASVSSSQHAYYYPGMRVYNDPSFMNFSYEGQVQSKSDPMAHLSRYHSMRKTIFYSSAISFKNAVCDASVLDMSSATQSSCMRFRLSGINFNSPSEIKFAVYRNNSPISLYSTNYLRSYYPDNTYAGTINSPVYTNELSLGLEGYGNETELQAFMMMSNAPLSLQAGDIVRVTVICEDADYYSEISLSSAMTLTGGRCHSFVRSSDWKRLEHLNYEHEGEVVVLQTGCGLPGLDLVLLGDGFQPADIDDGSYGAMMTAAAEAFFSIKPFDDFRDLFTVSYVKAASVDHFTGTVYANGADNADDYTRFAVKFTANSTFVTGDSYTVREYAKLALGEDADTRIKNTVIVVIANQPCHAGTCHSSWTVNNGIDYGYSSSIVFMGSGKNDADFVSLVRHEAGGHGFGKLDDEYQGYVYGSPSASLWTNVWNTLDTDHSEGRSRNVSKYVSSSIKSSYFASDDSVVLTTEDNVYWSDLFGTSNNYESTEGLGCYEGASTFKYGYCRPTELASSSVMNGNGPAFNAPSRRQIYYRICRLNSTLGTSCFGTSAELNAFLAWDAANYLGTTSAMSVEKDTVPPAIEAAYEHTAPVEHIGHWENGVFIEEYIRQ